MAASRRTRLRSASGNRPTPSVHVGELRPRRPRSGSRLSLSAAQQYARPVHKKKTWPIADAVVSPSACICMPGGPRTSPSRGRWRCRGSGCRAGRWSCWRCRSSEYVAVGVDVACSSVVGVPPAAGAGVGRVAAGGRTGIGVVGRRSRSPSVGARVDARIAVAVGRDPVVETVDRVNVRTP